MKPPFWHADFGNVWLESLHEVPGLDTIDLSPTAPGPLFVLGLMIVLGCIRLFKTWSRWRAKAYQRQALTQLKIIDSQLSRGEMDGLAELNVILKRCAMKLSGRPRVAALSGEAWRHYLVPVESDLGPEHLNSHDVRRIENWAYGDVREEADQADLILPKIRLWITS